MDKDGEQAYPLILVFYLDRDMMGNHDIIVPFTEQVNNMITATNTKAMAFFLPTDGEERLECINPIQLAEADMSRVNSIVEDLVKGFDIGQGADDGKND
jgi:hypothetical protein